MLTKVKNNWPLLVLIAIHGVILFYDYFSIPFYHDELSAIERCKFNHFIDLIQKGIMVDGHPAGVHLFLFSMIQLFGVHQWILKLPFLLAGLGSLFFLYKISEFIFSRYAAIATGIFFIFLSYYISQIIVVRPYSPGLFFTLGAFYYGIKLKVSPFKKYSYIMMAVFAVGAMYTHYFSFLQVILIWGVVFVFNHKKIVVRNYLVAFAASILCFLPHSIITYTQLGMGGLGWLGKPDIYFFIDFFVTYFNDNLYLTGIASALFVLSFFVKKPRKKNKVSLLLLFMLPCIILFIYSLAVAPVLQMSALYFCSPFLLLFIGNGIDIFNKTLKWIGLIALLVFSAYVLVVQNQFYRMRNDQPIEKFVINGKKMVESQPQSKILLIWSGNSKYLGYYLKKQNFNHRIISVDTLQNIKAIDVSPYDIIICNQLPPALFYELNKTFPYLESVENNLHYTFMMLSKKTTNQFLYQSPAKLIFNFDTAKEWSRNAYMFRIDSLVKDQYHFIEFVPVLDSAIKGVELVLETYDGEKQIDWRSVYMEPGSLLSIKLKDVLRELNPGQTLKIFVWNSTAKALKPIEVKMFQRSDNPLEYRYRPE